MVTEEEKKDKPPMNLDGQLSLSLATILMTLCKTLIESGVLDRGTLVAALEKDIESLKTIKRDTASAFTELIRDSLKDKT